MINEVSKCRRNRPRPIGSYLCTVQTGRLLELSSAERCTHGELLFGYVIVYEFWPLKSFKVINFSIYFPISCSLGSVSQRFKIYRCKVHNQPPYPSLSRDQGILSNLLI